MAQSKIKRSVKGLLNNATTFLGHDIENIVPNANMVSVFKI